MAKTTTHTTSYNLRSAADKEEDLLDSQVGTHIMASGFKNREDPEYLKFMEDEVLQSRQEREEQSKLLNMLVTKMENMETKSTTAGVGRGILRTPLKDVPFQAGRGRGAGGPVNNLSGLLGAARSPLADPSPADLVNGPLTTVLQQLSIAIDPTPQSSVKGLLMRPEYYVQHVDKGVPVKNLDHSKLTFKELMSGMSRVMLHLAKTGGDLGSYLEHFSFITRKAGAHSFLDSAYVSYDRSVVDQVILGEADTFVKGDLFAVPLHFHAGNLVQPKPPLPTYFQQRGRGRGYRRGGGRWQNFNDSASDRDRDKDKDKDKEPLLEGFPEDVCYNYNYRSCHGKCSKSHVCRMCRGAHKAGSGQCPNKK